MSEDESIYFNLMETQHIKCAYVHTNEEEKLKFYITSCPFRLCISACSLQSGSHRPHSLRKWGLTVLGTGAYLTHPCPALCNCPAPAHRFIMPVRVKARLPPPHLDCCSYARETAWFKPAY